MKDKKMTDIEKTNETDISIIIPLYNESDNINDLCSALENYDCDKSYSIELIFVDDGSKDDTLVKVKAFPYKNTKVKIVNLSKNYGSHAAIRAGMTIAGSEYTMLFSGDLQEPVELIGMLFDKIVQGYDAVYVQKGRVEVKQSESLFSQIYAKMIQKFAVAEFPNRGLNNFMITSKVREYVNRNIEANSSIFLQIVSLGFKRDIITCDYTERKYGTSKWTFGKKVKLFIDSFVAFAYAPIRAISIIGILLSVIGGLFALYIIIVKMFNLVELDAGYPTLISVLLIGFGLTNISLGVLAEYLWRTLDASRDRPVFVIDEVFEL